MASSSKFNEIYYLSENLDVAMAVATGDFATGIEHFEIFGGRELRSPNQVFVPSYYLLHNLDVAEAVESGTLSNGFEHFQIFGEKENRIPPLIISAYS